MLQDKHLLITGVATPDSIAFATARAALDHGARITITALPRDHGHASELAEKLDPDIPVLPLDLTDAEQVDATIEQLRAAGEHVDGALHAVAFSPAAALGGRMTDATAAEVELAFRTSAWSLAALARIVEDRAPASGASIVALDFDANDGAWPVYNWMGVCKAGLRTSARYLARDLGPRGIRVNLVAAGPLHTRAASGIPGFEQLLDAWATTAPLAWSAADPAPVADATCFLLSDLARQISGEVLHVDGGYHAMAAPLRAATG